MKKYLITMGGIPVGKSRWTELGVTRNYETEVMRLFHSCPVGYFNGIFKYDNDWIKETEYYKDPKAKMVLDEPSFGWAFKGICVLDMLNKVDDGDVVMWVDSNHVIKSNLDPIVNFAVEHGAFLHEHWQIVFPNKEWTHRDTFIGMGCDEERYWNARQIQVNVMAFCKTEFTMNLVNEWVKYCTDYDVVIQNKYENLEGFKNHRHEQSILSILVEKYKIPYQIDPYQIVYEMDIIRA